MRRLVLLCLIGLSMTAAVAGAAPLIGRPAAFSWFSTSHAVGAPARALVAHKRDSGVTRTHRRTVASAASDPILFGDRSVEAEPVRDVAGLPEAFALTNSSAGSASAIAVYVGSQNQAKSLLTGLYADRNGRPGGLLASGSLTSPKAGAWNRVKIPSTTVKPGTYWLAVLGEGGTLHFRVRSDGSCQSLRSGQGNLVAVPSSWRPGATENACPPSA